MSHDVVLTNTPPMAVGYVPSSGISGANEALRRHASGASDVYVMTNPLISSHQRIATFHVDRQNLKPAFETFWSWLTDDASIEFYRFTVLFEGEDAHGDGIMREFFRLMWSTNIIPLFFQDNGGLTDGGLPLPSTRIVKAPLLKTLGKFIGLSLRYEYLPVNIHPLCYLSRLRDVKIDWRALAVYYDPLQANMVPLKYDDFKTLDVKMLEYFDERYHFTTDICDFDDVTADNYNAVRHEIFRRIVTPFQMQRTLYAIYHGINDVRCYNSCNDTMLMLDDAALYELFEAANRITADTLLLNTTYKATTEPETQRTYQLYGLVLQEMTPAELKKWCLFVTNSTIPRPMVIGRSENDRVRARTCFGTFDFARAYTSKAEMRDDMLLMMEHGFDTMTEIF